MSRGETFFLDYAAATMKEAFPADTGRPAAVNAQPLAVVPEPGNKLIVLAAGVPVPGASVNVAGDLGASDHTADADGVVTLTAEEIDDAGMLSVRANVTLPGSGEYDGQSYPETRRYATAVFTADDFKAAPADAAPEPAPEGEPVPEGDAAAQNRFQIEEIPAAELPAGVTSLGAAVSGGYLYYYGGHPGTPHKYSTDEQSGEFRRLNLSDPDAGWEDLPGGPKLQGLALVPHPDGGVVRVGGFTARNSLEEDHDLHSMPTAAFYNPETGAWEDLPDLPGGRSSFDAATLNGKVYVLGGWMMAGDEGAAWHGTGLGRGPDGRPGVRRLGVENAAHAAAAAAGERRRRRAGGRRGRADLLHRRHEAGGRTHPPGRYLRRGRGDLDPRPGPERRRDGRVRQRRLRHRRGRVRHHPHRAGAAPDAGGGRLGGPRRTGVPPVLPPPAPRRR